MATINSDGRHFDWEENWAEIPGPDADLGWAHHDLSLTRSGEIVAFHPKRSDMLFFSPGGKLVRSWPTTLQEGHGITVVIEDGDERIWVADPGIKMQHTSNGHYERETTTHGQVVQFNLNGTEMARLEKPPHPDYETGRFAPTAVNVDEVRLGGSGDIWVADGYGASLLHRFAANGSFLQSLSGEEGGGHFNCPHSIYIDRRREEPELWVADRGNGRVQVYNLKGEFLRNVGEGFLNSPSAFAPLGRNLVVAELWARLAVVDLDDQFIGYLGDNGEVCDQPGWPNSVDHEQHPVRSSNLHPGRFNSPHGLAIDAEGNIYVTEFLIGGRMIRLQEAND